MPLIKPLLEKAGLRDFEITAMERAIWAFPEIDQLVLFGSRAQGSFQHSSDVDLAIYGGSLTDRLIGQFHAVLTEGLPFPKHVDVIDPSQPWAEELVKSIERDGIVIYDKHAS